MSVSARRWKQVVSTTETWHGLWVGDDVDDIEAEDAGEDDDKGTEIMTTMATTILMPKRERGEWCHFFVSYSDDLTPDTAVPTNSMEKKGCCQPCSTAPMKRAGSEAPRIHKPHGRGPSIREYDKRLLFLAQ